MMLGWQFHSLSFIVNAGWKRMVVNPCGTGANTTETCILEVGLITTCLLGKCPNLFKRGTSYHVSYTIKMNDWWRSNVKVAVFVGSMGKVILGCRKLLRKCKKCDWMAFKSQLPNFYRTDPNALFSIVFASLFYNIILKLISYMNDKIRRKKCWKKGWIF